VFDVKVIEEIPVKILFSEDEKVLKDLNYFKPDIRVILEE